MCLSLAHTGDLQHLDDPSAERPGGGDESIPTTLSQRSAALPVLSVWNGQSMNDRLSYEFRLLMYWARGRPVARIHLATVLERRLCRFIRAAWTLWRMQALNRYDMFGCRGCGAFLTEATRWQCDTKWCCKCTDWSRGSCWKCYKPREGFNDGGEFSFVRGSASGDDSGQYLAAEASRHCSSARLAKYKHCIWIKDEPSQVGVQDMVKQMRSAAWPVDASVAHPADPGNAIAQAAAEEECLCQSV